MNNSGRGMVGSLRWSSGKKRAIQWPHPQVGQDGAAKPNQGYRSTASQKQGRIVPRNSGDNPLYPDDRSQIQPSELSYDKPGKEPANPEVVPQEDPKEATTPQSSSIPGRQTPLVWSHAHKIWRNNLISTGSPLGGRSAQSKNYNIPVAWQYPMNVRPDSTPSQRNNPTYVGLVTWVMINSADTTSQ